MNLNDLNIICLETVLEYLDIANLLNAADSSKRLWHAARLVYERKYGEMEMNIAELDFYSIDIEISNGVLTFHQDLLVNRIIITRPKFFLQTIAMLWAPGFIHILLLYE